MPSCGSVRPATCVACEAPSRVAGQALTIVGHGLRRRGIEGPGEPGAEPAAVELAMRRYVCRACDAVLVVVPRGVGKSSRYSLEAIGYALALWGYAGKAAAAVRSGVSASKARGFTSPEQWSSLRRWAACAVALFGAPETTGRLRERAAKIAAWLASRALLPTGVVTTDAFFGGRFVHAR